ncbi:MAG: PAS domain S-box protein [Isosphaeraceae bacterium]|nr:PAS domain S-box protein [Isosphaeraceae bacterium]
MAAKKRETKRTVPSEKAKRPKQPQRPIPVPEPSDEVPPPDQEASSRERGERELPVAGLVASAGGLDAFKKFFAAMPTDSGIAFVLIPHLGPQHESLMVELLGRQTSMPVVEAAEAMAVEANRVYIIPPNKNMTISGGALRLSGPVARGGWQTSIDLFLRSLADDQMEKAICIVLSGTGSHGALGLEAVKAVGGMAMVQDPKTAEYPRMPESAIATGLADYVLPVERMPAALIKYVQHFSVDGTTKVAGDDETQDNLNQLLALLRFRTKFDFRYYRKTMLVRRLDRRMGLCHIESLTQYLAHLREHPEEVKQLVRDLLIRVTRFFRDPGAFSTLETEVIAPLIQGKDADVPLRVWVPGCATGEEPYSVAMLLLEQQAAAEKSCRLQIFASDVDEHALELARQGTYPEAISADVSPERLARFFTRVDESNWQISKQVRETVTFAAQNLITDAPFSKMDLICCRNILIYLEPEVQKKVVALFHFALNEGGYLFLGPSESVGRQTEVFELVSKKWRIYRRIGSGRADGLQFPVTQKEPGHAQPQPAGQLPATPKLGELVQDSLLRRFALACVVINRKYEVVHYAGATDDYLVQPSGPPTQDLLSLARPGLESKLRVLIRRTIRENAPQSLNGASMRHGGVIRRVNIEAEPLSPSKRAEGLLLIAFQEQPRAAGETPVGAPTRAEPAEPDLLRQLEQELETTRDDLQSTIAELESANEELKASNEEGMSMNEELQSANEELETSKEELQSLNEELSTVNNQLEDKVTEVETAMNDMANLLKATEIATVFLDAGLRVKLFTPAATRMFHLSETDRGRPIGDVGKSFTDDDLVREARQLLLDLASREKEISTDDGHWWIRRIMPYRTLDNRIDGVVITFVDITDRKLAADAVVRRLAAVVESSVDAIFSKDLDGTIRTWNRGAERLYGYSRDEAVGRSITMVVPEDRADQWSKIMATLKRGESVEQLETECVRKDGRRVQVELTVSPVLDRNGKVLSGSVIVRDITERKQADEALRRSEEEFRQMAEHARDGEARLAAILNTAADAIVTIDARGTIQSVNATAERMFGYTAAEMIGQNVKMLMPVPYRDEYDRALARYLQTGEKQIIGIGREAEGRRKDGTNFPVDLAVSEVGHLKLFTGLIRDISRRKELERDVVEIASLEQRRIGQDLHDSVSQELTALSMLAGDLTEVLGSDPSKGPHLVERLVLGLQRSQQELRAVMRGLIPVSIEAEGLMAALSDLADRTQQEDTVTCIFDCPKPVLVEDNLIATHLYLIAQEAVHNAVKHAHCRNIRISVESNHLLVLRVQDDGVGISRPPTENYGRMGLRIMRNRAAIIRATLTIGPAVPTGTVLTCALERTNVEPQQPQETS